MDQNNNLIKENNEFFDRITQLNTDILFRTTALSTWQSAPPELRDAAQAAYNDSVSKSVMIKEALEQVTLLKSAITHIKQTINSLNPSENINSLIVNYIAMKTAFLANHGKLLAAEFTL
jgi:hypothetical protein